MRPQAIESAWQGPPQCQRCAIRHLVLFADLDREDFGLIHRPIEELRLAVGETLYGHKDAPEYVYTVRGGLLKLAQYLPEGRQRIVRLLRQGDLAGMEALLGRPYQHTALVLDTLSVCRIPVAVVRRLERETPRLHDQLMDRWQRALAEADAWLTELSTGPARDRVARLLLRLVDSTSGKTCQIPSREDIGAMLAISTETASRIIAELKRGGQIQELENNRVCADVQALSQTMHG
jgi:CRP/FNR family transcriptional regulator